MILPAIVEYAGFLYHINLHVDLGVEQWRATPAPGQHHAAGREKHRRAAVAQFLTQHRSELEVEA